jgi:hypothetical protein
MLGSLLYRDFVSLHSFFKGSFTSGLPEINRIFVLSFMVSMFVPRNQKPLYLSEFLLAYQCILQQN